MHSRSDMDHELESIDWDSPSYTLAEFLSSYTLPQIVCVRDGYLDIEEITTLSTDQIMTLHFVKPCKMLKGFSETKKTEQLSIPVNTVGKIEILPDKLPTIYKSVKAVKNDPRVKKVLSLHNHAWLGIKEQDVLNIEGCKKKHGKEYLRCSVINRDGIIIELPISYQACFHSYEEPNTIAIRDVEKHCTFPCTVRIKASAPTKPDYDPEDRSEFLDLSSFGRIKLMGIYDYDKIVASIRHLDKVRIMQIPISLEITVCTGKEANQKDSEYYQLCVEVHNNTQFQQMEGEDQFEYVKMGNNEDKVDNIYEYIDFRYVKPPIPPRPSSATAEKSGNTPPPVQPKPLTKPKPTDQQNPPLEQIPIPSSPTKEQPNSQDFSIPDDLTALNVEGVTDSLKYLKMDQYIEKFKEELIDGTMLVELSEDMMEESLGITSSLHRKKLKKFIDGWRPK
ncbi:GRB2-associated and regulator of MAPK protein-like [Exaiptasia diaphana]|nr:GRB2-associated and regulator of MAPK protein-like [Exaiptasia diaphana]